MAEKFPNNKFFRRLTLVWVIWLITVVVLLTWLRTPNIPAGTAAALATVVGILTVVIGFYQTSRNKEDKRNADKPVGTDKT